MNVLANRKLSIRAHQFENPTQISSRDVRVYIARYEYNPYEGPNPCPEVELYLHAGKIKWC